MLVMVPSKFTTKIWELPFSPIAGTVSAVPSGDHNRCDREYWSKKGKNCREKVGVGSKVASNSELPVSIFMTQRLSSKGRCCFTR